MRVGYILRSAVSLSENLSINSRLDLWRINDFGSNGIKTAIIPRLRPRTFFLKKLTTFLVVVLSTQDTTAKLPTRTLQLSPDPCPAKISSQI